MKHVLRFFLLTLVLMVVAMASALTAMRLVIHRREVRVPKLIGLTRTQAENALASAGLRINVESSFLSAEVPEGLVLSQYPAPNDKVRRGWRVRVAMSLGPQLSAVPDLGGEGARAAEINLRRSGFEIAHTATLMVKTETGTATVTKTGAGAQPGVVIAQSPQATREPIATPGISLLVSAAAEPEGFVMPSFIGEKIGESGGSATAAARAAGFAVHVQSVVPLGIAPWNGDALPGTVFAQNPVAGAKIMRGSVIRLMVVANIGPPIVPPGIEP